ncbi:major pollen allergen Aln g 1 [Striga asiatica]|uniref:Major pollen allergen Aln g 1 n=1 Tax=Striga asiatica TaxID=4170 RepID=A0A5A7R1F5_STRAF|nr:major pollen allergen Aln g 1 [Striga asiatica]
MGTKKISQHLETMVSPSRLFKILITESQEVLPKFKNLIKSVEIVQGHEIAAGCVVKTTFPDGAPFKFMTHRIDAIDNENYMCNYTLIDGDVLGEKVEKVCYEIKLEASANGGCKIKLDIEYHSKGDAEITNKETEMGTEQALRLYKAYEEYIIAHPSIFT